MVSPAAGSGGSSLDALIAAAIAKMNGGGGGALTYAEQAALRGIPTYSNNNSNSTSSSTNYSFQDPAVTAVQRMQAEQQHTDALHAYDLAVRSGDRVAATAAADRLARSSDLLIQLQSAATNQTNQNVFTGGENAKTREATAANQQAQNVFTAGQQQGQNVFTSGERVAGQQFTAGESALTRAQRAGEFAATYAIQRAQQEAQQRQDQLGAAKTFTDLSASPDLTGFSRFMAAGGGSLGGAIQRGANSFTPLGQLGAARALQTAQETPRALPDYVYNPGVNPYLNAGQSAPPVAAAAPVRAAPTVAPAPQSFTVANDPTNPAANVVTSPGAPQLSGEVLDALVRAQSAPGSPGATPRYALGTMHRQLGRRSREPVFTTPQGASIDAVSDRFAQGTQPRRFPVGPLAIDANADIPPGFAQGTQDGYAHGTFMTGDSTDPTNPAAGGAHPEQVSVMDPPGANNAEASVTPLVPPGVGDTTGIDGMEGGDPGSIGALLVAIGNFLTAQEAKEPQGYALGTQLGMPRGRMAGQLGGLRRYATGTDLLGDGIMESDVPYINQVTGMRLSTPYSVNPYASDYQNQSPTSRAIGAASFQTATGVPGSELAFEANKYQPGGLAQGAQYHRELSIGL